MASNILYTPLPFRLFSNLFSVTMLALLLRISSKIAQKSRYKIVEFILSTLLKRGKTHCLVPFYLIGYQNDAKCRSIDLLAAYAVVQPASAFGSSIKHRGMVLQTKIGRTINVRPQVYSVLSLQCILDLQVSHLTLEVARISEREDQCALIEHFGARIVHLGLPRVGVRVLEACLI